MGALLHQPASARKQTSACKCNNIPAHGLIVCLAPILHIMTRQLLVAQRKASSMLLLVRLRLPHFLTTLSFLARGGSPAQVVPLTPTPPFPAADVAPPCPPLRPLQVLLGASGVLSNGTVVSRCGSAAVAMMAASNSTPVLICCETYKFHERVQLDSITHNELGEPDALARLPDRPRGAQLLEGGWLAVQRGCGERKPYKAGVRKCRTPNKEGAETTRGECSHPPPVL